MSCLPDQFLFVNKTAKSKSLSHGNQNERFDIQSHVQSRQRKESKTSSKDTTAKSTSKLIRRRPTNGKAAFQTGYCGNPMIIPDTLSPPGHLRNQSLAVPQYWIQNKQNEIVPKPTPFSSSGDPFSCTSVPLDSATHRLLQYPFSTFIESIFHAESLGLASGSRKRLPGEEFRHRKAIAERLNRCTEDELILYATLSYCSSCIRWSTGEQQDHKPPEYYVLKAIELLRPRLERLESVDGWLIVAIYALSVTELWAENSQTAIFHLRAVKHCIEKKGGMQSLEPYVMESLILNDKYTALLNETAPILPLNWDPGSLPDEKAQIVLESSDAITTNIGANFLVSPCQEILDPELLSIISDIIQCVQFAEAVTIVSDDDERWLFLRHSAFMYRLLALDFGAQPFNECCRLGLIIWLLKITAYNGAQKHIKRLLPRLKAEMTFQDIEYQEKALDKGHVSVLFWVASVGAMGSEYTDERDWFIEQTSHLCTVLGLPLNRGSYKSFLRSFLFLKAEDGLNFARIVRRAKEMRGETMPYV